VANTSSGDVLGRQIVIALKAVVLKAGRMLIIKRAEDAHVGSGTWETTGGKLEFGETLQAALAREVKEECGIEITVGRLLYATTFETSPTRQVVILAYLCHTEQDLVSVSSEHTEYLWASKCELRNRLPDAILSDFDRNGVFSLAEWEPGISTCSTCRSIL
jgi:8-oxo-dGTP diphosphatase